ncbi:MAG: peptidoglycan bridge formation glycyltransferase FemA/FemB family protein [Chloroflexi bacterium]|nr:peptidoglycan bridge formation glycyltransferase FemA/FemB family protein [Chloroflexota bacterium]
MTIREIEVVDREKWDSFVEGEGAHILQSYAWGEFKSQFGWNPLRLAVEDEGRILAAAQVLIRPLPIASFAYLPKGPVVAESQREVLSVLLGAVHRALRRKLCIFLRVEPDGEEGSEWGEELSRLGFRPAAATVQPQSTILVDVQDPAEVLLGRMKPKTRYNIGLAQKKGVAVREGVEADFSEFYRLLEETSRRDGFFIRSEDYYRQAWQLFSLADRCRLLLATFNGQVIAGLMAFVWGKRAWYLYGASSQEQREVMPNHLLQWQAMLWAKERGCTTYDLWGIPDEVGRVGEPQDFMERKGGLWGVYRFKRGFGGHAVRSAGAFDYIYSRLGYWVLMELAPRLRPTVSGRWEGW